MYIVDVSKVAHPVNPKKNGFIVKVFRGVVINIIDIHAIENIRKTVVIGRKILSLLLSFVKIFINDDSRLGQLIMRGVSNGNSDCDGNFKKF